MYERKDIMKTTSTYCVLRWGYPIVDFGRGSIRTCCRTFEERVEPEEFEEKVEKSSNFLFHSTLRSFEYRESRMK